MARNINAVVMKELCKQHIGGTLPVLLEIYNEQLVWGDNSLEQENMYLRLINDSQAVRYKGKKYIPCAFDFSLGEEDGKTLKPATLTVSAIDSRMSQLLRMSALKSDVSVKACFLKKEEREENGETAERYYFFPMANYKFKIASANYTRTSATLVLAVEDLLTLQVPRDKATQEKFPALSEV